MQLWESIFRSHHPGPAQQSPPEPRFIPDCWPSVEDLLLNSDQFEVAGAEVAQDDVGDVAPAADEREYGEQHRDEAVKSLASVGVEAIGFFAPIHFFGSASWVVRTPPHPQRQLDAAADDEGNDRLVQEPVEVTSMQIVRHQVPHGRDSESEQLRRYR